MFTAIAVFVWRKMAEDRILFLPGFTTFIAFITDIALFAWFIAEIVKNLKWIG